MGSSWYTGTAISAGEAGEGSVRPLACLQAGDYITPKHGPSKSILVDEARLGRIAANFNDGVLETGVMLDFNHERKDSAGWLVAGTARVVPLADKKGVVKPTLVVDADYNPYGQQMIADNRYRFQSIFVEPYVDEDGKVTDDVMHAVSLTNKPIFKRLPGLTDKIAAAEDGDCGEFVSSEVVEDALTRANIADQVDDYLESRGIVAAQVETPAEPEPVVDKNDDTKGGTTGMADPISAEVQAAIDAAETDAQTRIQAAENAANERIQAAEQRIRDIDMRAISAEIAELPIDAASKAKLVEFAGTAYGTTISAAEGENIDPVAFVMDFAKGLAVVPKTLRARGEIFAAEDPENKDGEPIPQVLAGHKASPAVMAAIQANRDAGIKATDGAEIHGEE